MQLVKVSILALLSGYVAAQDIDDNDVPQQCRSVCASVVTLTETCDRQNNDNDSGFINCVCTGTNAASIIPACEACVANFDRNDGADNDVNDFVRSCSFARTAYTSMSGSPTDIASVRPGTAAGVPLATLTGSQSSSTPVVTGSASTVTPGNTNAANSASSSTASLSSAAAGPSNTNAASANGVKAVGVVGALFLGFIGLA
ncbi:uncharacterized protein RSE6_06497 [Rhynchosporium secalis]|uniref:Extracellular membrane protein CFEM domain-containing protein n=1 Tax=Rhynchosporium secalis TaxID=38038 RepID=A0A1E1MAH4_RHYSE|nr:uncharacterized protein RSE6_06497 [Rhynchosporium secalis]